MDRYRLNELPQTYKQCKTYTDQFEDWLIKTAKKRGLELAREAEAAAKEKARQKKGKGKKPYKLAAEHLLPLAQGIVEAGQPLEDTSGLRDLRDAIRSRKEVTQWYKHNNSSDEGHPFFITLLNNVHDIFKGWIFPTLAHEHDVEDESSPITISIMINTSDDHSDDEEEAKDQDTSQLKPHASDDPKLLPKHWNNPSSAKKPGGAPLTNEELELEEQFEVLCFLYDLSQLRESVAQAWLDYKDRKIGAIPAALVTDLALSVVQQNVNALIEDLENNGDDGKISKIIIKLYRSMTTDEHSVPESEQIDVEKANRVWFDLLCLDGIGHMKAYCTLKQGSPEERSKVNVKDWELMNFLLYFDRIQTGKFHVPIFDKFTEGMRLSKTGSEPWLAFGLQILIDIQYAIGDGYQDIFKDVSDHGMHMSDLMRAHIEYEDHMWATETPPEYMSTGTTKFSNLFIPTMQSNLAWLKQLTDEKPTGTGSPGDEFNNHVFITLHPTLGGLVMYHYHKYYQSLAIQKVQWFVTAFAHLYNACRQIGGLTVPWHDLDFIIKMQGTKRIFIADPPTNPNLFYNRLTLAMCSSTRWLSKDYYGKWKRAPKEVIAKRGFRTHFPLEAKIREYYGCNSNDDRWIRLHNLFAHLKKALEKQVEESPEKDPDAMLKDREDLQEAFSSIVSEITPPKPRNRNKRKKSPRVKPPDFSRIDCIHAKLLGIASAELQDHELHANFDYLSFFRRAFALVTRVRSAILWNESKELTTLGTKFQDPTNFDLLIDLFRSLQIKAKDETIQVEGNELSKDVVATDQLKKIAKVMEDLICEEGDAELKSAKQNMRRPGGWWDVTESSSTMGKDPGLPKGLFHRFTYRSAAASRRRKVSALQVLTSILLVVRSMKEGWTPHRLVGARKRHISFNCQGQCTLGRVLSGRAARPRRNSKKERSPRVDSVVGDSVDEGDVGDDGWETDTDDPGDTHIEYSTEIQDVD